MLCVVSLVMCHMYFQCVYYSLFKLFVWNCSYFRRAYLFEAFCYLLSLSLSLSVHFMFTIPNVMLNSWCTLCLQDRRRERRRKENEKDYTNKEPRIAFIRIDCLFFDLELHAHSLRLFSSWNTFNFFSFNFRFFLTSNPEGMFRNRNIYFSSRQ